MDEREMNELINPPLILEAGGENWITWKNKAETLEQRMENLQSELNRCRHKFALAQEIRKAEKRARQFKRQLKRMSLADQEGVEII